MIRCLLDWPVFDRLFSEDFSIDLLRSWQKVRLVYLLILLKKLFLLISSWNSFCLANPISYIYFIGRWIRCGICYVQREFETVERFWDSLGRVCTTYGASSCFPVCKVLNLFHYVLQNHMENKFFQIRFYARFVTTDILVFQVQHLWIVSKFRF